MLRVGAVALALSIAPCALGAGEVVPIFSNGNGAVVRAVGDESAITRPLTGRSEGIVYDAMLFEGNVQTPTTGPGGFIDEDYVSTITTPSTLREFMFVGGVETAGHTVFFNFYDTSNNFAGGFGVSLPSAGFTLIWTITLDDPSAINIPAAGFVELVADDGTNNTDGMPTNAAWRYKDIGPAIGSTAGDVYRMKIDVIPTPGALALTGFGGLLAVRRRR